MRIRAGGFAAIAVLAAFCLALPALSQDVTVGYTGGYSAVWGSEGAGTYNGTLNGAPAQVICDDFQDTISAGQTWSATVLNAANLNTTNIVDTLFGSTIGLDGYAELATLVSYMYALPNGSATTTLGGITFSQADISAAIWYITGGPALSSLSATEVDLVNYVKSTLGINSMTDAQAEAYLARFGGLWIYTPDPNTHHGAQEMWSNTNVPEGGAALLYLLLAGAVCFGAMFFSPRKRLGNCETA